MLFEDESITFDEFVDYKHSTEVELANQVLDDLVAAARASDDELLQRSAEVLDTWDRLCGLRECRRGLIHSLVYRLCG